MPKISAGILMYKIKEGKLKIFLVHPGGPFWKDKDEGAWGIPKGEIDNPEEENIQDMLKNAIREMKEETGIDAKGDFDYLGSIKQKNGKIVHAWALEGNWSGLLMCSSYARVEYPYKSGKFIKVPEVDRADFFDVEQARKKIVPAQFELVERLIIKLKEDKKLQ